MPAGSSGSGAGVAVAPGWHAAGWHAAGWHAAGWHAAVAVAAAAAAAAALSRRCGGADGAGVGMAGGMHGARS